VSVHTRSPRVDHLLPLMVEISDELGSDKIQSVIFIMAWISKQLLDLTSGYTCLAEVTAIVEPSARAMDAVESRGGRTRFVELHEVPPGNRTPGSYAARAIS
jgi:hypothetical protein